MTGALFNPISFVWFPYHFDSCLNYVCVHFRRAGAADRRSPCGCQGRVAELRLLGEGGLSLVAAGAPPGAAGSCSRGVVSVDLAAVLLEIFLFSLRGRVSR